MKHLLRLAALLGLLILTGCLEKSDPVILHLAFDGSLYDSSSNHFSVNAGDTVAYTRDRFGRRNSAIAFDGQTRITVPNSPKLNFTSTSEYSISCWVRTDDTSEVSLIAKGAANVAVAQYSLQLLNGRPTAIFAGSAGPIKVSASSPVADNVWHLLTLSVSPDSINLYTDTTLVATGSGAQLAPQHNRQGDLSIGCNAQGQQRMKGACDDVKVRMGISNRSKIVEVWKGIVHMIVMNDMPPGVTSPYAGILDVTEVAGTQTSYACGTSSRLFKTIDAGATWAPLPSPSTADLRAISFCDVSRGVLLDANDQLFATINGGSTWVSLIAPLSSLGYYKIKAIQFVDPTRLIIAGSKTWQYGPGFIASIDVSTNQHSPTSATFLANGGIGGVTMLATAINGTSTRLLALRDDYMAQCYELSNNTVIGSPLVDVNNTEPIFQSADLVASGPGYAGLVGTQDGKVWKFYESSPGVTPSWTEETPNPIIPGSWVVGVRCKANSGWAISSDFQISKRVGGYIGSGTWSTPSLLPTSNNKAIFAFGSASNTIIMEDNKSTALYSGLQGQSLP